MRISSSIKFCAGRALAVSLLICENIPRALEGLSPSLSCFLSSSSLTQTHTHLLLLSFSFFLSLFLFFCLSRTLSRRTRVHPKSLRTHKHVHTTMYRLYVLAKAACSRINITEMMNYTRAASVHFYFRGSAYRPRYGYTYMYICALVTLIAYTY